MVLYFGLVARNFYVQWSESACLQLALRMTEWFNSRLPCTAVYDGDHRITPDHPFLVNVNASTRGPFAKTSPPQDARGPRFIPWEARSRFGQNFDDLGLKPTSRSDKNERSANELLDPGSDKIGATWWGGRIFGALKLD